MRSGVVSFMLGARPQDTRSVSIVGMHEEETDEALLHPPSELAGRLRLCPMPPVAAAREASGAGDDDRAGRQAWTAVVPRRACWRSPQPRMPNIDGSSTQFELPES